jgi:hypothetical protein
MPLLRTPRLIDFDNKRAYFRTKVTKIANLLALANVSPQINSLTKGGIQRKDLKILWRLGESSKRGEALQYPAHQRQARARL